MPLLIRTLAFTLLYPGAVCALLPWGVLWLSSGDVRATFDTVGVLGILLMLLGAVVYVWCAWDFGAQGRGTPAPYDPPRELVVGGLYRYSRNPMYVGIMVILLGEAALWHSMTLLIYAAIVAVGFHLRVVLYEEPALRRLFGESFERYCRTVRRW